MGIFSPTRPSRLVAETIIFIEWVSMNGTTRSVYESISDPDGWDHSFGSSDSSAGVAILTFVGSRLPSSDSLTLSD